MINMQQLAILHPVVEIHVQQRPSNAVKDKRLVFQCIANTAWRKEMVMSYIEVRPNLSMGDGWL